VYRKLCRPRYQRCTPPRVYFHHLTDDDIQVSFNSPDVSNTVTGNATEAEMKGAELEVTYAPVADLLIEGGAGYLDSEYKKLIPVWFR